jgi:hypothetical protein
MLPATLNESGTEYWSPTVTAGAAVLSCWVE